MVYSVSLIFMWSILTVIKIHLAKQTVTKQVWTAVKINVNLRSMASSLLSASAGRWYLSRMTSQDLVGWCSVFCTTYDWWWTKRNLLHRLNLRPPDYSAYRDKVSKCYSREKIWIAKINWNLINMLHNVACFTETMQEWQALQIQKRNWKKSNENRHDNETLKVRDGKRN